MLQRENGTATAEESVFLGSNPEVTRNDDFNSVFQYGMVKKVNTVVDKPIRTVISNKMLDSHSWQKLIGIASATDYSMQVQVLLPY